MQALNGGRRLVAHHSGVLLPQLHSFVLLALPSVEALRSTTSKIGMLLLQVSQTYAEHIHTASVAAIAFICESCYAHVVIIRQLHTLSAQLCGVKSGCNDFIPDVLRA